jgi:hypothetical protein
LCQPKILPAGGRSRTSRVHNIRDLAVQDITGVPTRRKVGGPTLPEWPNSANKNFAAAGDSHDAKARATGCRISSLMLLGLRRCKSPPGPWEGPNPLDCRTTLQQTRYQVRQMLRSATMQRKFMSTLRAGQPERAEATVLLVVTIRSAACNHVRALHP